MALVAIAAIWQRCIKRQNHPEIKSPLPINRIDSTSINRMIESVTAVAGDAIWQRWRCIAKKLA